MDTLRKHLTQRFSNARINRQWSFRGHSSIGSWTHGYHRYPAKFVPHLVKKIIETYSVDKGVIADLFAGCGTTLVESKLHGRRSIGIDINPVAQLITRAKTNAIQPEKLSASFEKLNREITRYRFDHKLKLVKHERIWYWYRKWERNKIAFLYAKILAIQDRRLKDFYLCALSNILKNSSRWLQSSTKPQIDPNKKPSDPFTCFARQVKVMMKMNDHFYKELRSKGFLSTQCRIKGADARKTGIKSNSVGMIITSPPYITSYEYADIHQLTAYWFDYMSDLASFRKRFIGTFYSENHKLETINDLAQDVVDKLKKRDTRTAKEVAKYFDDMNDVALEMKRILRTGGRACLVVGNTTLQGVKIKLAEIVASILADLNFEIEHIIHRSIPDKHKQIPTIRDKTTGRFTKLSNKNSKLVYPNEYIIVAKKQHES